MDHTDSEQQRFERIFRAHHLAVNAYVRRRTTAEAVDDVVSETFLVAWRRLDAVPEEPLPWLLGVARNTLATRRRSDARRLRLQARAEAEYQYIHDELDPLPLDSGRVISALERLEARDREALTLVAWDGLTPTEAAETLGIPANRFRVRLHRAARRLRWALDAEAADREPQTDEAQISSEPARADSEGARTDSGHQRARAHHTNSKGAIA